MPMPRMERPIPTYNRGGFRADWKRDHRYILEYIIRLAVRHAPGKLTQREAGMHVIREFPMALRRAGWWAVGLEYNRVCRKLGIRVRGGKGPKEILSQVPCIEDALRMLMPEYRGKIKLPNRW